MSARRRASRLASLLFAEADDPLRALRWSLAEIRRGLGPGAGVDGDPVQLTLPPGAIVDVDVLVHGHWNDAVELPGLGLDLLDGLAIASAEPFESWLLSQRVGELSAATESIVHEAALGLLARGELVRARELAVEATVMSPLDENHQALLIRVYRLAGDDDAAAPPVRRLVGHRGARARHHAGRRGAAGDAGATGRGASRRRRLDPRDHRGRCGRRLGRRRHRRRRVVRDGRPAGRPVRRGLRGRDRLVLAEALIHTLGGLDEDGLATLTEAERIALGKGDPTPWRTHGPSSATWTSCGRATTARNGCSTRYWPRGRRPCRPARRR